MTSPIHYDNNYALFDYAPVGMCIINRDLNIIYWNRCLEDWSGRSRALMLGSDIRDYCPKFKEPYYLKRIDSVFYSEAPVVFSPQLHKSLFPVPLYNAELQIQLIKLTVLPPPSAPAATQERHALFSIEDVTELSRRARDYREEREIALSEIILRKKMEEELRASLSEKEYLIREVHHRVKNNLSIISALIGLQETNLYDQRDCSVLDELRGKIHSIGLIHEKLYGSSSLKNINFEEYLSELLPLLYESTVATGRQIEVRDTIEAVGLPIDTAIPLAMIITELFMNALKYAFPHDRPGTIFINLSSSPDETYLLTVKDDGVGLPPGYDIKKTDSLGFQLVMNFIEQLEGELQVISPPGTEFRITLPSSTFHGN